MLRFLLRRPKTVRIPIENGTVDIQKVKVTQRSKPVFLPFVVRVALIYCVWTTLTLMSSGDFKEKVREVNNRKIEAPEERKNRITRPRGQTSEQNAPSTAGWTSGKSTSQPRTGEGSMAQLILPVWFREKRRQMVKETDPEWQAFLLFQQDGKKSTEVKQKAIESVVEQLKMPRHRRQLQYIGFNANVGWHFDVVTPIWAPVAYEVPCLSITLDWRVQPHWKALPPGKSASIERIYHPVVFAQAFWAAVQAFSRITYHITKAKVLDRYQGAESTLVKMNMVPVHGERKKFVSELTMQKLLSRQQQLVSQLPSNRITEERAKLVLPFLRGDSATDSVMKKNYRNVISSTTYQEAIENASAVFKQTLLDHQMAALQSTTSGMIKLKGSADCMGARGRYHLEITAYYLPEQDAFVGKPRITGSYIIPDLVGMQRVSQNAVIRSSDDQKKHDKPVPQPQSPEKPSPDKSAGK